MAMRTTLWNAALLLGIGFSLALTGMSARNSPADAAAAPAEAAAPAGQAAPGGGERPAPPAAQEQGAVAAAAPAAPAGGTAAPPATQPPQLYAAAKPDELDAAIDRWRQTLARESGFEAWRDASWTSYPLGPGLHGYVVLLLADGKEVGYMIVTAAPDGTFKLTEYGTGSRPLFSLATLYRSAVRQELIPPAMSLGEFLNERTSRKERLYADPLHATWKVTVGGMTSYLDAKTGEALPLSDGMLTERAPTAFGAASAAVSASTAQAAEAGTIGEAAPAIVAKLRRPAFDPYERISWVTGKPLALVSFEAVRKALGSKQRLVYVAELYGGKVTVPLAVTGYHIWSGPAESYLAVDQDGGRYIRYAALEGSGRFFP